MRAAANRGVDEAAAEGRCGRMADVLLREFSQAELMNLIEE